MTLPEPLTDLSHDVSGLDGFMLNTDKLMASELFALSTGDEFKAAVALWARAWKQSPAGSLPDNDRVLAAFSGAGKNWRKVREMALRGFVKCSDGRLYHKTLCEDVHRASAWKAESDAEKAGAAERKRKQREERARMFAQLKAAGVTPPYNTTGDELRRLVTLHVTGTGHEKPPPVTPPVTGTVTAIQGQDRTGQKEEKEDERGSRLRDEWADLERKLREAAGWQNETSPNLAVVGPVVEALKNGLDLEMDLLPAARAFGPTVRSRANWKYILACAISARDDRLRAAAEASKPTNLSGQNHGKPTRKSSEPGVIEAVFEALSGRPE